MAVPVTDDCVPGLTTETLLVTVQVIEVVPKKPAVSVAVITTAQVQAVVGVPVTDPVDVLIDSPAGRPVADHVSVWPDWVSAPAFVTVEMAVPDNEDWLPGLVTATVLVTVQVRDAVPEKLDPSVALRTTAQVQGAVGVPVTDPVVALINSPAGSPVADHVNVAPDWVSLAEFVTVEMAVPVTDDCVPGLTTETLLVTVQVIEVEPKKPAVSVALRTTAQVQAVVGVPVTDPVAALIDSPAGSPVADHVSV